jgi:hypothetical protein
MKKVFIIYIFILNLILLSLLSNQLKAKENSTMLSYDEISARDKAIFEENRCMVIGRLGIIKDGIFIVIFSKKNALLVQEDEKSPNDNLLLPKTLEWEGLTRDKKQVVFVYKNQIFETSNLPDDFSINESILISFEGEKVIFFDYATFHGGYYKRNLNREKE